MRLKPDEADVVGGDIYGYAGIFVHLENEVAEFWHMEFRTPRSGSHPEEEGPFEITTTVSNVVEAIQSITEPTGLYDYLDVWPEPSALQLASYRAIDMIWGEYDAVARVRIRAPHEYKKVSWAISGWPQGPRPSGQTWIRTKAEVQAVYGGELPGSIDLVNIYRDIHPDVCAMVTRDGSRRPVTNTLPGPPVILMFSNRNSRCNPSSSSSSNDLAMLANAA